MSETMQDTKISPMMAQWHSCKKTAGSAVLLFRMGDFYEAFYEDASILSKELELTLTKRMDIPMAGIPHHTSESYIDRLVSKGYRVAVAEQLETADQAKGLVKRGISRIVTPGTVINSSLLSDKTNNFVASITQLGKLFGFAILDLTTGEFQVIETEGEQELLHEIFRLMPAELVLGQKFQDKHEKLLSEVRKSYEVAISTHDDWRFEHQVAHDFLMGHFKVSTLDGFGLRGKLAAINASGALLSYIQEILNISISHIIGIQPYNTSQYMMIDKTTQRHLELTDALNEGSRHNTLLHVIDKTCTPMGARLLRQWVKQPLLDITEISLRQDGIETFIKNAHIQKEILSQLNQVQDIERLIMKICSGYASPRDLVALKNSFLSMPRLKDLLETLSTQSALIAANANAIETLPEMVALIEKAIVDEPPMRLTDGKVFRDDFCAELAELRALSRDSKSWLVRYQEQLKETTGIKTLKIGYNRMFGYYIEVSKGQADKMPPMFQRRQTLINAERFITPELKEFESKVTHAEERMISIENELFAVLKQDIIKYGPQIQRIAQAIARIDAIQSLSVVARQYDYSRPVVDTSHKLHIIAGRHPVIEGMQATEKFIPNDTLLDDAKNRLILITGPNMAGKSTYIRQVALIAILAQMGSFVPALNAHIGLIDKIFSRIGASDDLSRGQSTFMVEMVETANILNNATNRSLIILDEIGRGTSTYDGISIAWSVAEFLLTAEDKMAKTLFATHYCELIKLEEKIPGAVNYHVAVHENGDAIIFLRKIVRGGTDKSYGIHVGRLAGLPLQVIERAKEILVHLEENANRKNTFEPAPSKRSPSKKKPPPAPKMQLTFF